MLTYYGVDVTRKELDDIEKKYRQNSASFTGA